MRKNVFIAMSAALVGCFLILLSTAVVQIQKKPALPPPSINYETTAGSIILLGEITIPGTKFLVYNVVTPTVSCVITITADTMDKRQLAFPQLSCK